MTDNRNAFYLLSAHGDPWAIEATRMKAYLNTLIVSDMTADEAEKRTGPMANEFFDCAGRLLEFIPPVKDALQAALTTRKTKRAIGVLRLTGPITQRAGLFTAFFGGTSTEKFGRAFDDLVASDSVGAILIDADTPGGTVSGVPELAEKIFKARGVKPIVVVSNAMLASAGYWLGSSADEIVVTPSGEVGSIGVWSMHVDISKAMEDFGEKVTLISAGKFKTEWNPFEPLTKEAEAYAQTRVDDYYGQFVGAVARGRGVSASTVRKGFGQGRMVGAKQAVQEGMADRVGTLEQTIQRLGGRLAERDQARAEQEKRDKWLAEQEKELGLPQPPPNRETREGDVPATDADKRQTEKWKCPKCGSGDVEVGRVVLACLDCGWTLIGEVPCESCGEPSVGYYRAGDDGHSYCQKHFPKLNAIVQEMADAIVQGHAD